MKSAYEKAMERMEAESGPTKKLSDEDKEHIADIDKRIDAKIAELKLACDAKLATTPYEEVQALQTELASEIAAAEKQREDEKSTIWDSAEE